MTETRPKAQRAGPIARCGVQISDGASGFSAAAPGCSEGHQSGSAMIPLSLVQRQVRQLRAEMAAMDKKMELARQHAEHGRMQLEHLHAMLPTLVAEDSAGGLLNVLAGHMWQRFGLPTCRLLATAGGDGLVQMEPESLATVARLCGRDGTFCGRLPSLEARLLNQAMESDPCAPRFCGPGGDARRWHAPAGQRMTRRALPATWPGTSYGCWARCWRPCAGGWSEYGHRRPRRGFPGVSARRAAGQPPHHIRVRQRSAVCPGRGAAG